MLSFLGILSREMYFIYFIFCCILESDFKLSLKNIGPNFPNDQSPE